MVGGEKLKKKGVGCMEESCCRACTYINEYGPTEATVGCSIYRADKAFFRRL